METVVLVLLILINLVLWLVFFAKFKSLFSTKDLINDTREQLNRLIAEVQRNTSDNIDLIDDKIEQLNQVLNLADRKLSVLNNDKNIVAIKKQVEQEEETPVYKQPKTQTRSTTKRTSAAAEENPSQAGQPVLSDSEVPAYSVTVSTRARKMQTQLVESKKKFSKMVKDLYLQDYNAEEIAQLLGSSVTEVELAINMIS